MTVRSALLATAAVLVVAPVAALAQPISGPYVGVAGGINIVQDADVSTSGGQVSNGDGGFRPVPPQTGTVEFDTGWAGFLTLGWGFGNGMRVELEGGYRSNDVDSITLGGTRATGVGGRQTQWSGMVNALYDFNMGWINPYIGLGVGYAQINWEDVKTSGGTIVDDSDGQFAYQGIIGASVPLSMPGLSLTADYRYFATLDPSFAIKAAAGGGTIDSENKNHTFTIGLRYAFGAPAAPAPAPMAAAPAPAPARTYLVFFDWDRADLTDRARGTIREAAGTSSGQQVTRIEVSGHADRSGAEPYNMRLSRRRADNVAAELVRNGVQRNQIFVQAFGETRPLVPTADGVREPQNRRVEIVLR